MLASKRSDQLSCFLEIIIVDIQNVDHNSTAALQAATRPTSADDNSVSTNHGPIREVHPASRSTIRVRCRRGGASIYRHSPLRWPYRTLALCTTHEQIPASLLAATSTK